MSLAEHEAAGATAAPDAGVDSYRVVDRMDRTGRLTVESSDGTTYTVVGTGDERISRRLRDCAPGATVRLELILPAVRLSRILAPPKRQIS